MKILILGGTQFVGRHITAALLDRGHDVTLFGRGRTNRSLFPTAKRIIGDRNAPLAELARNRNRFDACVDVSGYTLSQVERTLEAIGATVERYVFISTISVYKAPIVRDFTESAPVEIPEQPYAALVPATYGRLKVACENAVRARCGDRATIFRLGLVNGPHDHTDRATSWLVRAIQGGTMAVPAAADAPFQVIDPRDIGLAVRRSLEQRIPGTYMLVQSPTTWKAWIETARTVRLPGSSPLTPTGPAHADALFMDDQEWIEERAGKLQGSRPMGALPMYLPKSYGWEFWRASNAKARAAGFTFRPYEETIRDTLRWRLGDHTPLRAGLTQEQESGLLSEWRSR